VEEEPSTREGRLLGMIPVGRRFAFEPDGAVKVIEGKVGEQFSQSHLEAVHQFEYSRPSTTRLFLAPSRQIVAVTIPKSHNPGCPAA
jgi:hypothetical protein